MDSLYRLSDYTFHYSDGNNCLLTNTLSGADALLSAEEWNLIKDPQNKCVSGQELESSGLSELVRQFFLVPKESDDYQKYRLVLSVTKTLLRKRERGFKLYTVLPTTACNARCVYCYEEGMKVRTMTDKTADSTADYIARTKHDGSINITWFGGEPLAAKNVISRICKRLNDQGVDFKSRIITNGSLLTEDIVREAKAQWHLEFAQISVDGNKADYEARKQYADPQKYNYENLLDSIGLLLDNEVRVNLRCNYDRDNIEGMKSFWNDLDKRFGSSDKLSVYTAMLFQEAQRQGCAELYKKMKQMKKDAAHGFFYTNRSDDPKKFRTHHCMADSDGKEIVIDPDGLLYHCEHLPGAKSYGSIFDRTPPSELPSVIISDAHEACKRCCFLPLCTPFFRNGCPDWNEFCAEFKRTDMEISARNKLSKALAE